METMSRIQTNVRTSEKEMVSLLIPKDIKREANDWAKSVHSSLSKLVAMLLRDYLQKLERERIEKEIIEACKSYYGIEEKIVEDWKFADSKI